MKSNSQQYLLETRPSAQLSLQQAVLWYLGLMQNYRTPRQQDCKLHYCRNTEPPHNGDEDPEPERTIRQKKQGDINCMEEKGGKNGMYAQLQDPKSTAKAP